MIGTVIFDNNVKYLKELKEYLTNTGSFDIQGDFSLLKTDINLNSSILESKKLIIVGLNISHEINIIRTIFMNCNEDSLKVVLYDELDKNIIAKLLELGLNGLISKKYSRNKVINFIEEAVFDKYYLCPNSVRLIMEGYYRKSNETLMKELTEKQRKIVDGVLNGLSYKEVADFYNISVNTVNGHLKKVYRKLQISSRSELQAKF
jgi:hypothetical protein